MSRAACLALLLCACPAENAPPSVDAAASIATDATTPPPPSNVTTSTPAQLTRPEWIARGSHVDGSMVYGLGSARGIKNPALAMATAANRARAEVARLSGKKILQGVEIVDRWQAPDGTHYALAKMQ